MKYDTWDNVYDFPMKELNVLIGHYVTQTFHRFSQICGFNEGWNGEINSALVGILLLPPSNILHALVLLSSKDPFRFFSTFDANKLEKNH